MTRRPDLERLLRVIVRKLARLEHETTVIRSARAELVATLSKAGYTTRELAELIGTSQPAVIGILQRHHGTASIKRD